MSSVKKLFAVLLTLCLIAALGVTAFAAGNEYTYTVRFYAGAQGTIDGKDVKEITGLHYGDRVSFDVDTVTLNDDSKYYVRGIRESGQDNSTVGRTSFVVTRDQDYVVAYGVLGKAVAYTVHYVDANNRALSQSVTYYGNVGDKPVVAFRFIDGYEPQAYNLTKTLSENAADNVFTFSYRVAVTPTPAPTATPANQNAGAGTNTPAPTPTPGSGEEPQETAQPEATAEPSPEPTPEEIIDLDTPLSGPDATGSESEPNRGINALVIAGIVVGLGVLGLIVFWLIRRRRKEEDEE